MKMNSTSDLWVNEYTFMYSHMNPKKLENFLYLNSIPWVHLTEAVINCPCLSLISLSCIVSRWRILYLLKCDWIHFWIVSSSIQEICEDRFGRRLNAHKKFWNRILIKNRETWTQAFTFKGWRRHSLFMWTYDA